jgi:hypothetical protein
LRAADPASEVGQQELQLDIFEHPGVYQTGGKQLCFGVIEFSDSTRLLSPRGR